MATKRFFSKLSIELPGVVLHAPVMQASLGRCDSPALAAAVSRAGGLGTFSVHNPAPDWLRRRLEQIKHRTPRPVLLAFTAQWEGDAILETALAHDFRLFQVFWWNGPRLAPRIRRGGGTIYWQVGTIAEAREAVGQGASVLVAQGTDAGGQVRSAHPVAELIAELRTVFGAGVTLIAGGGFADAHDTQAALAAGADAALFGTRFLLSEEANASPQDKARLLRATAADLCLDTQLVGDWPCAPRRRLHTAENHDRPGLYAGAGVARIRVLRSAADIVRRLTPVR